MTWSYSGDPSKSAKDQVRFLIGDTDSCDQLLQDGEITWVLSQYNNTPMNAAIRCCEAVMSKLTRLADESVGQVRISFSQKAKAYREMRRDLVNRLATEDAAPYAGGITVSDVQTVAANTNRVRPSFTRHMFENPAIAPWVTNTLGLLGDQIGSEGSEE